MLAAAAVLAAFFGIAGERMKILIIHPDINIWNMDTHPVIYLLESE